MKRLVFTGKAFIFRETADVAAPQQPRPATPQRRRLTYVPNRMADFRPISSTGNGYKPGKLLDLGKDQCRFSIRDKVMCGARVKGLTSWCPEHDDEVHGRAKSGPCTDDMRIISVKTPPVNL